MFFAFKSLLHLYPGRTATSYFWSCLVCLILLKSAVLEAQPKKIYIAPDDHTDYMWTANEANYNKAFVETLDYYLKQIDSTAHEPYRFQSKWNCDGSYWIYQYRKNKDKASFKRLIDKVKKGNITVPLNTLVCLYGVAPTEAVVRSMYYAGALEREFGLDLNLAFTMEDQVLPLGLSSIFAGCGAKYSWRGVCNCATKVTSLNNRPHQMYWYKGLDEQKVLMKWYSFRLPNKLLGGYSEAYHIGKAIDECKALMDNNPKYPYSMAAAFGKGGDDFMSLTNRFIAEAKQKSDSSYQVIVSNETDFLADFEKEYGKDLPSETVSYGTEWGNSVASLAEVSASVKRSVEKLRTAEALFSYVALKDSIFGNQLKEKKEQAWLACGLYFEHDWTADGKTISRKERADWQRKIARQISSYVDTLYDLSLKQLGKCIVRPKTKNPVFYVFNSLGWKRTEAAALFCEKKDPICVVDKSTGMEIPYQWMWKNGREVLQIMASDVPAFGYKIYEIIPKNIDTKCLRERVFSVEGNVVENAFYRITVSRKGSITSWIDKKSERELVKPVANLYVNDLGGENSTSDTLIVENSGEISLTLKASSLQPLRHSTRLTFYRNNGRIDIDNKIEQNFSRMTAYAFSFNLKKPNIWHEETGAVLHAKPVSQGGHYADSLSRLDWLTLNHFADISDSVSGITLSNRDAYFMKTGNSSTHALDFNSPQINVLAGGQVDADKNLGIEAQGGDTLFQTSFALRSHAGGFDPVVAMKFSLEHQNPLVAESVTGSSGYSASSYSLITISNPNVLLWSAKPAEEGINKGLILKFWNMAPSDLKFSIHSNQGFTKAGTCTHIETDIKEIQTQAKSIDTEIGHQQLKTYRVFLK